MNVRIILFKEKIILKCKLSFYIYSFHIEIVIKVYIIPKHNSSKIYHFCSELYITLYYRLYLK